MSDLSNKVLSEIESRGLKPRPASYFLGKRAVFWTLAALSVAFGSISAAVIIFGVTDFIAHRGQEFDEMPLDDVAWFLPFIWLVLLGLFVASALIGVRNTRRGYRYSVSRIVMTALAASIALGTILHLGQAGVQVHKFLARHVPVYAQYTTIPYAYWSRPAEGFLGGEALREEANLVVIRDFHGKEWQVDLSQTKSLVDGSLVKEGDIAIRGQQVDADHFRADLVAPFD